MHCSFEPLAGPATDAPGHTAAQMQHFRISSRDGRRENRVNPLNG